MIDLHFFVHYFEAFVGFNAAIIGFEDTRKMIYGFFSWKSDIQVEYEGRKINAGLQKIKVYMDIYKILPTDVPPPWEETIFNDYFFTFCSTYDTCKAEVKQLKLDTEEHEREYVEKRVPPWLIFCLLYCIMLILLCGFAKTYHPVEKYSFIFLAYFNSFTLGVFILNQLYNTFLKRPINNLLSYLDKSIRLGKKRNVQHSYFYVFRHIKRFFLVLIVSVLLTFLSYYLTVYCHSRFLSPVFEVVILIETLCICFFPLLLLISCGLRWKNRHIKPLLEPLRIECRSLDPVVYRGLKWVRESKITY